MMFQYLVSALATGATIVLYDGSPLKRPETVESSRGAQDNRERVQNGSSKSQGFTLRQTLSTGSPLPPALHDYVNEKVKKDVLLGSVTGGTDICSVFAGRRATPRCRSIEGRSNRVCSGLSSPFKK